MRYIHKAKLQQRDGGLHGLIISYNLLKYLKDRKGERDAVSCLSVPSPPLVSPHLSLPIIPSKMVCTLSILADEQSD